MCGVSRRVVGRLDPFPTIDLDLLLFPPISMPVLLAGLFGLQRRRRQSHVASWVMTGLEGPHWHLSLQAATGPGAMEASPDP